ncbi:MAG: YjfB family protein [Acetivibrio sp.]
MDIPGLSMALSQQNIMTQVNVAVLSQNLSTVEAAGEGMVKMMEQSVTPSLGQTIDICL